MLQFNYLVSFHEAFARVSMNIGRHEKLLPVLFGAFFKRLRSEFHEAPPLKIFGTCSQGEC